MKTTVLTVDGTDCTEVLSAQSVPSVNNEEDSRLPETQPTAAKPSASFNAPHTNAAYGPPKEEKSGIRSDFGNLRNGNPPAGNPAVQSSSVQGSAHGPVRQLPVRRAPPLKPLEEFSAAEAYSLEAEMSVLGCTLLDPNRSFPILAKEGIGYTHWYDLRLAEIYQLMEKMYRDGEGISETTVYMRGQAKGMFSTPEERNLLFSLSDNVASALELETFLPELKDCHQRRLTLDVARRLGKLAQQKDVRAHLLLQDAEEAVKTLRRLGTPEEYSIRTAGELVEQSFPENDNILGDRLLAKGQSFTLLGAGGIGKSRFLLQMAACCIAGRPFLDLRTHAPGSRWLIFQAENSNRRLQQDLAALRKWLRDDWEKVSSHLLVHTLEQAGDSFVQLDSTSTRQRLADLVERYDADVVCFDPLNCFGAGDLNRDADMRQICQLISRVCLEAGPIAPWWCCTTPSPGAWERRARLVLTARASGATRSCSTPGRAGRSTSRPPILMTISGWFSPAENVPTARNSHLTAFA